jgi:flagellar L-ring protein precursor FlgH
LARGLSLAIRSSHPARPVDLSTANIVRSDHLGQLEVRLNGKGVVGDAIRRPFILYRMLMGILPL